MEKKLYAHWLNPQKNTRLIDVASGTGDIAKLYLSKVNNKGHVYCVDENKGMLDLNKKKLKENSKLNGFAIAQKNYHLKIIILIIIQLVLVLEMLDNLNNALKEAYRVLKPGGRFLCLEFSKVKNEILNKFYKTYSKSIPQIGKFIVGKSEPYEYLINSIEKFHSQEKFLNK